MKANEQRYAECSGALSDAMSQYEASQHVHGAGSGRGQAAPTQKTLMLGFRRSGSGGKAAGKARARLAQGPAAYAIPAGQPVPAGDLGPPSAIDICSPGPESWQTCAQPTSGLLEAPISSENLGSGQADVDMASAVAATAHRPKPSQHCSDPALAETVPVDDPLDEETAPTDVSVSSTIVESSGELEDDAEASSPAPTKRQKLNPLPSPKIMKQPQKTSSLEHQLGQLFGQLRLGEQAVVHPKICLFRTIGSNT